MKRSSWPTTVALLIIFSLIGGCKKQAKEDYKYVSPAPSVVSSGPPPTDEEYLDFGRKLEEAIRNADQKAAEDLLRFNSLCERCISDLGISQQIQQEIKAGFVKGSGVLVKQLITQVQNGEILTSLGLRTIAGQQQLLIRISGDEGLAYWRFTLARYPDGTVAAEDIYLVHAGESISQVLRRLFIQILAGSRRDLFAKINKADQELVNSLPKIKTMVSDIDNNRHQEAYATYQQLSPSVKQNKLVLFHALRAGAQLEDEVYLQLLETYRKKYADDPSLDIILIDYYILKKNQEGLFQCIDRLEKSIGGDPFLYTLRGNAFLENKQLKEAKAAYEKAIELEPTLEDAYWQRIQVALEEGNHEDTLNFLQIIILELDIEITEASLRDEETYAKFVKSPQFAEFVKWLKERDAKK
ncbi:MAG: tetratricopeptide repeat protein [Zavarzinella sp.]